MAHSAMRVNETPLTRSECGTAGVVSRLLTEDWNEMTAAARKSPNHVSALDRWVKLAKEKNPTLSDRQAERLAERLRHDHYVRMGRLSAQARKLAREAQAELDRAGSAESAA